MTLTDWIVAIGCLAVIGTSWTLGLSSSWKFQCGLVMGVAVVVFNAYFLIRDYAG